MSWTIKASPVIPALEEAFPEGVLQVGDSIILHHYTYCDGDEIRFGPYGDWDNRGPSTFNCPKNLVGSDTPFEVLDINMGGDPFRVHIKDKTSDIEAIVNLEGLEGSGYDRVSS